MIADCQADVLTIVEQQRPAVILAIGPDGAAVFAAYLKSHAECRFSTIADQDAGAHLGALGAHALALISRTFECMGKTAAGALFARVRDLHARRLRLVVPVDTHPQGAEGPWQERDLIAYGWHCVSTYG